MAGARKLQGEIDKTLKKVQEGLELFDDMRAKLDACDTPSLKTKMEEELKRELKKLQKHRDAIKGWASSSEVKIKTPNLLTARRDIEERMEAFKAIERESKMKAYSKEGLMRDAPTNPEERRRMKTKEWIQVLVDKLTDEMDAAEKELERLEEEAAGGGGGKKKPSAGMSAAELKMRVKTTHQFHVDKLELLMEALDAGRVDPDVADGLKGAYGGGWDVGWGVANGARPPPP